MKKITLLSLCLVLAVSIIGFIGCKGGGGGGGGKIDVGTSCEGIGSSEARMHCDGAKTLFCSSLTQYKYKVQHTCSDGQVCKMAADGKSATCEKQ